MSRWQSEPSVESYLFCSAMYSTRSTTTGTLLLICLLRRVASGVGYSSQQGCELSHLHRALRSDSACLRLMPYVWYGNSRNQTRGIWSESKSIIHCNMKPRVSKCKWITYSRLLRVDQVAPPVFKPVNYRFKSWCANHLATAPHTTRTSVIFHVCYLRPPKPVLLSGTNWLVCVEILLNRNQSIFDWHYLKVAGFQFL